MIVRDLVSGPRRFVELQRVLPGISTEQLRSRLNRMVADGMLTRMRYREVPPRVDYELTERARTLMPILGELARWGYEWAWSTPRASECVDVGAIFRLAPGLLSAPARISGSVELVVHADPGSGEPDVFTLTFSRERTDLQEHPAARADARIAGTTAAWVTAFSPGGDRRPMPEGLEISGDRQLAARVLDGLALGSAHAVRAVAHGAVAQGAVA